MTNLAARSQKEPRPEGRRDLPLSQIQRFIGQQLEKKEFDLFSEFAERHGSWEATFSQPSDEFIRFISIALTNEFAPSISGPDTYTLEVWVGADSSPIAEIDSTPATEVHPPSYFRHMVTQCKIPDDAFLRKEPENNLLRPEFEDFLSDALSKAVKIVESIHREDLTAAYSRGKLPKR